MNLELKVEVRNLELKVEVKLVAKKVDSVKVSETKKVL